MLFRSGQQPVELDGRVIDAWWLVREPAHPYDLRVEVWLGAQQEHWPLKLRQTQIPGGEPLEWLLRQQPPPGRSRSTEGAAAHPEARSAVRSMEATQ